MENLDIFIDFIENEYYVLIGCSYIYILVAKATPLLCHKTPPSGGKPPSTFWSHFFTKSPSRRNHFFLKPFFYKITEIPHPIFGAIFLQTHPLGPIYKIDLTGHFFTKSLSTSYPFLSSPFFNKITEIS